MLSYIGNTQRYNLPYHIFVRPVDTKPRMVLINLMSATLLHGT